MPKVLRWLSTKLNCSSQTATLLAATAGGDVEIVKGIIAANPELGLYNSEGVIGGGRSALTLAAERGDLKVLKVVYDGAVKAKGESYAKQALNQGAQRGQTPLMRASTFGTSQHVECVKFLLEKGADPCSETETGDNCLHMAAKNGYTECMNEILQACVAIGTQEPVRLADVVLPYSTPVKYVDLRNNAGMTALHMTALRQCPSSMQLLLLSGATTTLGTLEGSNLLSRGSTALHIAAARGSQPCCSVLLDHESGRRGSRLRSIRNDNGMKASHVARLAGHEALGDIISSTRGVNRSTRPHRRRRSQREEQRTHGSMPRQSGNPLVVLQLLKERANLLLSLREIGLELDAESMAHGGPVAAVLPKENDEDKPVLGPQDEVSTAIASFTKMWQNGELENSDSATQGMLGAFLQNDPHIDTLAADTFGKEGNPFAASALTQACLNALAFFSPAGKALSVPPTEMRLTHPLVAEILSRVALRRLAAKGSQAAAAQAHTSSGGPGTSSPAPHRPSSSRQRSSASRARAHRASEMLHTMPLPDSHAKQEANLAGAPDEDRVQAKARRRRAHQHHRSDHRASSSVGDPADIPTRSSEPEDMGMEARGHKTSCSRRQKASRDIMSNSPGCAPQSSSAPAQEGQLLAESDNLVSQLSLAPLAVQSTYTPFEGEAIPAWGLEVNGGSAPATPFAFTSAMTSSAARSRQTPSSTPNNGTPRASWKPPVSRSESEKLHYKSSRSLVASPTPASSVADTAVADSADSSSNLQRPEANVASPPRRKGSGVARSDTFARSDTNESAAPTPTSTPRLTPTDTDMLLGHSSASESEAEDLELGSDGEYKDGELHRKHQLSDHSCTICMDRPLQVSIWTCGHKVCFGCAYQLASRGLAIPICPFCRGKIADFASAHSASMSQESETDLIDPEFPDNH